MYTRHDLTDEQWAKLEPLLPDRTPIRGGRWMDHRKVINGVLWRTRSGSAWRDLPPEYGNWKTVYNRHRRWSGDGTWRKVLTGLRVDCDLLDGGDGNDIGEIGRKIGLSIIIIAPSHNGSIC